MFRQKQRWAFIAVLFLNGAPCGWAELKDPTRPLGYVAAEKSSSQRLRLNSVLLGNNRKVAVINGQWVRERETIRGTNGIAVNRILPGEVVLQQAGGTWRLKLNETGKLRKRPVAAHGQKVN